MTGVKLGEVLVDIKFFPNDDMDMNRKISGHGKGKQNKCDIYNPGSESFHIENDLIIFEGCLCYSSHFKQVQKYLKAATATKGVIQKE